MSVSLVFRVDGTPKPKGSMRHIGNGRMIEQVKGSKEWRQRVALTGRNAALKASWATCSDPVTVLAHFYLPRPKTAKNRVWPHTRSSGDVDKLCRNILDALDDAGILADDSQVVNLHASKAYEDNQNKPGCVIRVSGV